jgi:hypothetical protein
MSEDVLIENSYGEERVVRRVTLILVIVNLFATTFGGYFFIGRYEAKLMQSEKELSEQQTELAILDRKVRDVELTYLETRAQFSAKNEKLSYDLEMARFLNEARPKLKVRAVPDSLEIFGKNVKISFIFENTGTYDLVPKSIAFELVGVESGKTIELQDLEFQGGQVVAPSSQVELAVKFSVDRPLMGKYHYSHRYTARMLPGIEAFVKSALEAIDFEESTMHLIYDETGHGVLTAK